MIRADELDELRLDPYARVILEILGNRFAERETGVCGPSIGLIARLTQCSVSTVQRRLQVLERAGAIAIEQRSRGGRYCTHAYRVLVGSWRDLELAVDELADACRRLRDRIRASINKRFERMRWGLDRLDGDEIRRALELKLGSDDWLTNIEWRLPENLATCRAAVRELGALTGRVLRLGLQAGAMGYQVQNAISYAGAELRLAREHIADPVGFAYKRIARQLEQVRG